MARTGSGVERVLMRLLPLLPPRAVRMEEDGEVVSVVRVVVVVVVMMRAGREREGDENETEQSSRRRRSGECEGGQ